MSSTFLTLKNLVYNALGRDSNDTAAALIVPAAINYAITSVALIFKPDKLNVNSTITVTTSGTVSFASLDLIDVIKVYDDTDGRELFYIPFENWEIIVPTLTTVKFYTIFGTNIYVKGTPLASKDLIIYFLDYPSSLVNDTDTVGFDHHDSYIISVALAICFAAFEEGETVDVWSKVADGLGMAFLRGSRMREVIAGKTALLESTITGALAGAGTK